MFKFGKDLAIAFTETKEARVTAIYIGVHLALFGSYVCMTLRSDN